MNTNISFMNSDKLKLNDKKVCCFRRFFICVCRSNRISSWNYEKKLFPWSTTTFSSLIPCPHKLWGNTGRNLAEAICKNYILSQTQIHLIHEARKWKPNSQHTFTWSNWNPPLIKVFAKKSGGNINKQKSKKSSMECA